MDENEAESPSLRIPEAADGIQVNFCKNVRCPNFGVPASTAQQPRGKKVAEGGRDSYTVSGAGGHRGYTSTIRCNLCRETPPLKSNQAIVDEINRLSAYLVEAPITCLNERCENHSVDLREDRSAYRPYGKTKAGSQRYLCRVCHRTFIIGSPAPKHQKPHKNTQVFRLLVNKMPLKRISEAADISMPVLYEKIDFIHERCLAFSAARERKLLEGMPMRRLYVAVDRQDYLVNWSQTEDKRNIQLSAIGSADNTTKTTWPGSITRPVFMQLTGSTCRPVGEYRYSNGQFPRRAVWGEDGMDIVLNNPTIIIKMLDIFRVFYNFVEAGKDKETPAMRLGLAKSKVDMENIIYYAT